MKFTNFSNEDFIGYWDGTPWNIKAGETIMLQAYLSNHFAKHLINRELNKIDESTGNEVKRDEMLKKCLGDVVAEVESKEKAETEVLNQNEEDLSEMSRKELNKIAEDEGIAEPKELPNKQAVVDAINDVRSDEDKNMPPIDTSEIKENDKDEEGEFEGNDENK